ncbi:ribokinase [Anaeromyxobacter oryzae]|uniref:Ribokinase n=1 Tax=Anaeromyxobacter oryzae TaxID=2918170 RepID=A0ABM7X102_9BACT|nr:ribokinase [Anaeromyxobacter oryzae]BDG05433.1 ribokinase [Anaeromyxobacter oryzae]
MSAGDVVVVGSLNMDLVVRAPRLPAPGETILGGAFATVPGGKGGNQAVAAARLGARTAMVGRVGDDAFGRALRAGLEADGIDCAAVRDLRGEATGVALIVVDDDGRNGIVVAPGANARLAPDDVPEAVLAGASVVALQLEVPLAVVEATARRARALGRTVVLNPAPARPLPPALLADADLLVPNEIEAGMLTGVAVDSIDRAFDAGARLREQGAHTVLVTLGERGVVLVSAEGARHFPARSVKAVDTTAAGDTFIGGLCAALARGRPLPDAIGFAQAAAAISVTRPGAQPSIPWAREVVATAP